MANESVVDDRVERLMRSFGAYKNGVRIDDSMTFEQARLLNAARKFHQILKDHGTPKAPKVIHAEDQFQGGKE